MLLSAKLSVLLQLVGALAVPALQPYDSLAGLTRDEVDAFARSVKVVGGQPIPPPIKDTSLKLVVDKDHQWKPLRAGDQRGPCPGLNALASHGWLPRTGIVTPGEIVTAVQNGYNMEWKRAVLVTYAAFLVNGNHLTNLLSLGGMSWLTGHAPPPPALASGLNTHGTFEGDASLTRSDAFLGDNHSFNETLFQQLVDISNKVGGGKYNASAAAEVRFQRVQDSIARNPTFNFANPRFNTAFVEAVFPIVFFIDGRLRAAGETGLDLKVMRGFFEDHRMPKDFHRRGTVSSASDSELDFVQAAHDYIPGFNNGSARVVNNFVADPNFMGTQTELVCALYEKFVNSTVALYPNPHGELRKALNQNLDNFYVAAEAHCDQIKPYN
ncbi:aromatic peroxygenase precursor [Exidia glandulosa HHB12029]|uniref:Aromatic peroxygenase n=1 Tax=Exidia glandulosa HHB12029 TaxID=1314781 RepID=A0A165LZB8_EXIGL|nr:aromatic peroxygenase precursor [Exidia glandulosa HHB12029]